MATREREQDEKGKRIKKHQEEEKTEKRELHTQVFIGHEGGRKRKVGVGERSQTSR